MKSVNKAGFTIIETMLFLGITGVLIASILVGTGTSINVQRYRDSVSSLQSLLQQQYSDVANVVNDHGNGYVCDSADVVSRAANPDLFIPVGQSECVLMGRYIHTVGADGNILNIVDIVGYPVSDSLPTSNDVDAINSYKLGIYPNQQLEQTLSWGVSLAKPGTSDIQDFSILIIRSPASGVIKTFIDPNVSKGYLDIQGLVTQEALGQSVKMCVNSNGLIGGVRTAVVINAYSTSASGVETLGDASSGC
ncbi:MAG: hypothetical protein WCQ49_00995 [Candidatus Saccharibacteria bacterium]